MRTTVVEEGGGDETKDGGRIQREEGRSEERKKIECCVFTKIPLLLSLKCPNCPWCLYCV